MKKIVLLLIIGIVALFGEESRQDSSITKIKISDVEFYAIKQVEEHDPQISNKVLKPFAIIQPDDKWFSKDKWMHFTTSYFITLQTAYTLDKMLYTKPENARYVSIGISFSLSLGKELYDALYNNSIFSWKDLSYDILGSGLGYLTTMAIQR